MCVKGMGPVTQDDMGLPRATLSLGSSSPVHWFTPKRVLWLRYQKRKLGCSQAMCIGREKWHVGMEAPVLFLSLVGPQSLLSSEAG